MIYTLTETSPQKLADAVNAVPGRKQIHNLTPIVVHDEMLGNTVAWVIFFSVLPEPQLAPPEPAPDKKPPRKFIGQNRPKAKYLEPETSQEPF